jgi:DNA-directed RNA polymerase subunit N (RpoN/RPB10)
MIAQTAHSSLSHVQFVSSQEKFEGLSRVFLYLGHQNLCCRKCVIASHKNCKDIVLLEEVVDNVKNSSSVQEMEHLLDDLTKNIKAIITSGQDNLEFEDLSRVFLYFVNCPGIQGFLFHFLPR